ncbi:LLM class flavin-dependent oxidoreductase [Dactylosporangium sp. NPDC051484]|uniref:LLM class flavin-dependent oxidoreductase n=1 Tax=Dactylosporangium sp. NPDC051484 TaxID=3154942 RepID=UPI00344C3D5C
MVTGPDIVESAATSPDLEARIDAAVAVRWEQPPVVQPSRRATLAGQEPTFKIGALWRADLAGDAGGTAGLDPGQLEWTRHVESAKALERAGIDYVLLTDGYAGGGSAERGLRSVLWAVPVILATERLGVVTVLRTNFTAPTHVARFGAHLDWLSQGRWGWCVATGRGDEAARLYGLDEELPVEAQVDRAAEVVAAVEAIWQGREQGVEFEGRHVRVHGHSKRPFPTQLPRPPIFGVGDSAAARSLAGASLDVWIAEDPSPDALVSARAALAEGAQRAGRAAPRIHLRTSLVSGEADTALRALASRVRDLAADKLIDGLLLDLPGGDEVAGERVRALVDILAELGVAEDYVARTGSW